MRKYDPIPESNVQTFVADSDANLKTVRSCHGPVCFDKNIFIFGNVILFFFLFSEALPRHFPKTKNMPCAGRVITALLGDINMRKTDFCPECP